MQITIDIPMVSNCEITDCAYNINESCHAHAITIGDGLHPGCDTYFSNITHTTNTAITAGVGACKVATCRHNSDFECKAESINVGHDKSGIRCLTYVLG